MIADNLNKITSSLSAEVKLVAVSKTKPLEDIIQAYDCGQRLFGENKALEMRDKQALLPNDIKWHFIGHLQSNKVKFIAPFVTLIHGVDSLKLLKEINHQAKSNDRIIDCLLQISISNEETKFGMDVRQAQDMLLDEQYLQLTNIRLCGVMGIGSITNDKQQTQREFAYLREVFEDFKQRFFHNNEHFTEISMGMSDDYDIAIKQGATIIRLGSTIFGHRNYNL